MIYIYTEDVKTLCDYWGIKVPESALLERAKPKISNVDDVLFVYNNIRVVFKYENASVFFLLPSTNTEFTVIFTRENIPTELFQVNYQHEKDLKLEQELAAKFLTQIQRNEKVSYSGQHVSAYCGDFILVCTYDNLYEGDFVTKYRYQTVDHSVKITDNDQREIQLLSDLLNDTVGVIDHILNIGKNDNSCIFLKKR